MVKTKKPGLRGIPSARKGNNTMVDVYKVTYTQERWDGEHLIESRVVDTSLETGPLDVLIDAHSHNREVAVQGDEEHVEIIERSYTGFDYAYGPHTLVETITIKRYGTAEEV